LESPATVYYQYHGEEETANGTLRLTGDNVEFLTRHFFVKTKLHWYRLSDILEVTQNRDELTTAVLCPAIEDEDEEVIRYTYQLDEGDIDNWVKALSRTEQDSVTSSATPVVVREIIREIVKIKCSHCGNLYDQKEDRCPHCGGA
jgi:rubrerythrin